MLGSTSNVTPQEHIFSLGMTLFTHSYIGCVAQHTGQPLCNLYTNVFTLTNTLFKATTVCVLAMA